MYGFLKVIHTLQGCTSTALQKTLYIVVYHFCHFQTLGHFLETIIYIHNNIITHTILYTYILKKIFKYFKIYTLIHYYTITN